MGAILWAKDRMGKKLKGAEPKTNTIESYLLTGINCYSTIKMNEAIFCFFSKKKPLKYKIGFLVGFKEEITKL